MEFAAKVDIWFLLSFYGGALFMFALRTLAENSRLVPDGDGLVRFR